MSTFIQTSLDDKAVVAGHVHPAWAGSVNQERLIEALKAHNIPQELHPRPPSDHVCLGRAVNGIRGYGEGRVESCPNGWSLTLVDREKLDLENPENTGTDSHTVSITAKVITENDYTYLRFTPPNHVATSFIRSMFEYERTVFSCAKDLSPWFSKTIIPWCSGVAARARGGSWFVPQGKALRRLCRVADALHSVSQYHTTTINIGQDQTLEIPSVEVGGMINIEPRLAELGAIRTLVSNLIAETDLMCDEIHETLTGDKAGKRKLRAQQRRATALENKLTQYSAALGIDLADIQSRLDELQTGLGMAEIAE